MADSTKESREECVEGTTIQEQYAEALKRKKAGELTVKINVDVSEALTGLKAVTREAREATKALRELEAAYDWRKRACDNITRAIEDAESSKSITDDIRRSYE